MGISTARETFNGGREVSMDVSALVVYPITAALLLWLLRYSELVLFSRRESVRRENAQDLRLGAQVLAFYGTATILSSLSESQLDEMHIVRGDAVVALLWCGNFWWLAAMALRPLVALWRAESRVVPVERAMVCPHKGFIYHRSNEFMFLVSAAGLEPANCVNPLI
jgi:hypothetical protein